MRIDGALNPECQAFIAMTRIPRISAAGLDDEQREVYRAITEGRRSALGSLRLLEEDGTLNGPFGAMLLAPPVGRALSDLGEAIRFDTSLTPRIREIATLVVAGRWRSDYEWYAHEAAARATGLRPDEIEALFEGRRPHLTDLAERIAHDLCYAAVYEGSVETALWDRCQEVLGLRAIVEIIVLVGYYSTLALMMDVLEIGAPPGERSPFRRLPQRRDSGVSVRSSEQDQ